MASLLLTIEKLLYMGSKMIPESLAPKTTFYDIFFHFNVNSKNHQHLSANMKLHIGTYQQQLPKENSKK